MATIQIRVDDNIKAAADSLLDEAAQETAGPFNSVAELIKSLNDE